MKDAIMIENDEWKIVRSKNYKYDFNKNNGFFRRWGETVDDDPEYSPIGPELLDLELSTVCHRGCEACFLGGTKITMSGNTSCIEDVDVGSVVLNNIVDNDIVTNQKALSNVDQTHRRMFDGDIIEIELYSGAILEVTPEHPIYVRNKGWVTAGEIREGDELIGENEEDSL